MTPEPTEEQNNQARGIIYHEDIDYVAGLLAERAEHEATMQRVSEAFCKVVAIAERVNGYQSARTAIKSLAAPFIQPDPTPTPEQVLADAAITVWPNGWGLHRHTMSVDIANLLSELAKHGYEIRKVAK